VHRGLDRLNVRGLAKVQSVALLAALSFNLLRMIAAGIAT
jgi:IS5 family transposase